MRTGYKGRRRSGRGGSRRRKLDWQRAFASDIIDAAPDAETISAFWVRPPADRPVDEFNNGFDTSIVEEDLTLIRTRPYFKGAYVVQDVTDNPQLSIIGAGIVVHTNNDANQDPDPDDVPSPINDGNADWVWHWDVSGQTPGLTSQNFLINVDSSFAPDSVSDVRAQRKLSANQGLAFVVSVANFSGTFTRFAYLWYVRALFKLP